MEAERDPELMLRDYNQKLIELLKENQKQSTLRNVVRPARVVVANKNNINQNDRNMVQPREASEKARKMLAKSQTKSDSNLGEGKSGKYVHYQQADSSSRIGSRPSVRKPIVQGVEYIGSELPPKESYSDRYREEQTPIQSRSLRQTDESYSDSMRDEQQNHSSQAVRYAEDESEDTDLEQDPDSMRSMDDGRNSLGNKSSTPVSSPTVTPQGTPKSILRRRKLIDDHIQVRSKYPHTPMAHVTPRQGGVAGLNYSYSEADDDDEFERALDRSLHTDLNGSYTEEWEQKHKDPNNSQNDSWRAEMTDEANSNYKQPPPWKPPSKSPNNTMKNKPTPKKSVRQPLSKRSSHQPTPQKSPGFKRSMKPTFKRPFRQSPTDRVLTKAARKEQVKQLKDVDKLVDRSRLKDSGNDRKNAKIVRDLAQRPKAVLFDLDAPEAEDNSVHSTTMNSQSNTNQNSRNQSMNSTRSSVRAAWQESKEKKPLMGYDWIAGLLDNERSVVDEPDEYFRELSEFRKRNKYDCVGKEKTMLNGVMTSSGLITPVVRDPQHTCIHGYSVTERLFTAPMQTDERGASVCPVCRADRKPPTTADPGYVRVSIPRSTIAEPYRVMPHRRCSFDPSDSCALASHCLQGWQNAKPSAIPTAATVDLKQGIKDRQILSYDDVQKLADKMSKLGRLLDTTSSSSAQPNSSQHLNRTSNNNSTETMGLSQALSQSTRDLLDNSQAIRAELQYLDRHAGIYRATGPSSTNHPPMRA